ncbi:hypothetical protein [Streptomyces rimosus]|uniref:hypothetical protein n=1 Tax=Streptomyces rimosus TaxID=1927 RepID=UPI0004C8FB92|nr:hypothetical protein [Streptomyces rimosus]
MANQHSEKLRGIRRIPDQLWEDFGTAADQVGSDRSAELRHFMEWYVHRPGVELPERPAPQ